LGAGVGFTGATNWGLAAGFGFDLTAASVALTAFLVSLLMAFDSPVPSSAFGFVAEPGGTDVVVSDVVAAAVTLATRVGFLTMLFLTVVVG